MSAKINILEFRKNIKTSIKSLNNIAFNASSAAFTSKKEDLVSAFNEHPATIEIEDGPEALNTTETMGGYGNLFSLIGFDKGSKPIEPIRKILKDITLDPNTPIIEEQANKILFKFRLKDAPTVEDIEEVTPYPNVWSVGSWLKDLEGKGIANLRFYIFKRYFGSNSRSSTGIQKTTPGTVRGQESFKPIPYLSKLLKDFYNSLK